MRALVKEVGKAAEIKDIGLTIGGGKAAEEKELEKEPEEKKRRTLKELTKKEFAETGERVSDILNKATEGCLKLADEYGVDRNEFLERVTIVFFLSNKMEDFANYKIEEDADE